MSTEKTAVMTYLHSEVYQQLKAFKQQHRLRSLSHSVEIILERYLILGIQSNEKYREGVGQPLSSMDLLLQLSQTCMKLQQEVYELRLTLQSQSSQPRSKRIAPPASRSKQVTQPPASLSSPLSPPIDKPLEQTNLSTTPVSISPDSDTRGWTGVALAERLQTYGSLLSRKRSKPGFTEWTRSRDPEGIGWEFRSFTCRFHPLIGISDYGQT